MLTDDKNRGKIVNRNRAKQLRDFSGLRFGNITPTDNDGMIEYHDKGYVFMEAKLCGTELPRGQQLAFERLTKDLGKIKPSLFIVCEHNLPPDKDIDMANTDVSRFYYKGIWHYPNTKNTTKNLVDRFLKYIDNGEAQP